MRLIPKHAIYAAMMLAAVPAVTSCQDKDIDREGLKVAPLDEATLRGALEGDDYVWTWSAPAGLGMQVTTLRGTTVVGTETVDGNRFVHPAMDTNIEYTYVFKLTDGENLSSGVVRSYLRPGASRVLGLTLGQADRQGGYDVRVAWDRNDSADEFALTATDGTRDIKVTLGGDAVSYMIPDVAYGQEWTVSITASNGEGPSLPASASLRIGKTAIGYLGLYPDAETLVSEGDDDEASAWLWLQKEYPSAQYVYAGSLTDKSQLDPYRVLFFMRDVETGNEGDVFAMPQAMADGLEAVKGWYADGGSMLLWSHGVMLSAWTGRISLDEVMTNDRAIGCGPGGWNGDIWKMAVMLNPDHRFQRDQSGHPLFAGIDTETTPDTKLIAVKGGGWSADHNCCFFNLPSLWTGLGNQEEACYNRLVDEFGIIPLATWDSQIWWVSQFNVWEAAPGNSGFAGTLLCIGNGGCEFSLKNADGTPDISARPKNNVYQANILTMARNALEYLKTR